jgi:hypothetical protein
VTSIHPAAADDDRLAGRALAPTHPRALSPESPGAPDRARPGPNGDSPADRPPDARAKTGFAPASPAATPDRAVPPRERAAATRYGGVFFLIGALLRLGVYGDFTRPRANAVDASPWWLIAALARVLLGDRVEDDDALWSLLAALAGPDDPDRNDRLPDAWSVEPEWIEPFAGPDAWTWSARQGRLRIDHPAGFPIADVALDGDPREHAARVLARFEATAVEATRASDAIDAPRREDRWVGALAAFLRVRLARAVGTDDVEASVRLVLNVPARVVVTDTHVGVHIDLAVLPIEVRMVGLDRDPGWVPAAGRFVAFHFQ